MKTEETPIQRLDRLTAHTVTARLHTKVICPFSEWCEKNRVSPWAPWSNTTQAALNEDAAQKYFAMHKAMAILRPSDPQPSDRPIPLRRLSADESWI